MRLDIIDPPQTPDRMVQASRHHSKASNSRVHGPAWRQRLISCRTIWFSSA